MGTISGIYYLYRAEKKGDSVLQKKLLTAELSNNKELIMETLFGNAFNTIPNWSSSETFDKALTFIDKGLNYAKSIGRTDYEASAYTRKATLLRKRGDHGNAIQQEMLALTSIANTENDSLKTIIFLETGDIFLAKIDAVSAYKNYNNAFDLAYQNKDIALQSEAYHRFARL